MNDSCQILSLLVCSAFGEVTMAATTGQRVSAGFPSFRPAHFTTGTQSHPTHHSDRQTACPSCTASVASCTTDPVACTVGRTPLSLALLAHPHDHADHERTAAVDTVAATLLLGDGVSFSVASCYGSFLRNANLLCEVHGSS